MRLIGGVSFLALVGAMPALAAELPTRKAGLWEVKMSFENRNGAGPAIQQCIDAATDQMMQSGAGPLAQAACSRRDIQKSGNTVTIDSACTVGGKAPTSHPAITGTFDRAH